MKRRTKILGLALGILLLATAAWAATFRFDINMTFGTGDSPKLTFTDGDGNTFEINKGDGGDALLTNNEGRVVILSNTTAQELAVIRVFNDANPSTIAIQSARGVDMARNDYDTVGNVAFYFLNDGVPKTYEKAAEAQAIVTDVTDGSEDGKLQLRVMVNGVNTLGLTIENDGSTTVEDRLAIDGDEIFLVPSEYSGATAIQDAVDAAELVAGTVIVEDGVYTEAVLIDNTIKLIGSGPNTIIDGTTVGHGIQVNNANDVTLRDFAVRTTAAQANAFHGVRVSGTTTRLLCDRIVVIDSDEDGFSIAGTYVTLSNCIVIACDEQAINSAADYTHVNGGDFAGNATDNNAMQFIADFGRITGTSVGTGAIRSLQFSANTDNCTATGNYFAGGSLDGGTNNALAGNS